MLTPHYVISILCNTLFLNTHEHHCLGRWHYITHFHIQEQQPIKTHLNMWQGKFQVIKWYCDALLVSVTSFNHHLASQILAFKFSQLSPILSGHQNLLSLPVPFAYHYSLSTQSQISHMYYCIFITIKFNFSLCM